MLLCFMVNLSIYVFISHWYFSVCKLTGIGGGVVAEIFDNSSPEVLAFIFIWKDSMSVKDILTLCFLSGISPLIRDLTFNFINGVFDI